MMDTEREERGPEIDLGVLIEPLLDKPKRNVTESLLQEAMEFGYARCPVCRGLFVAHMIRTSKGWQPGFECQCTLAAQEKVNSNQQPDSDTTSQSTKLEEGTKYPARRGRPRSTARHIVQRHKKPASG